MSGTARANSLAAELLQSAAVSLELVHSIQDLMDVIETAGAVLFVFVHILYCCDYFVSKRSLLLMSYYWHVVNVGLPLSI